MRVGRTEEFCLIQLPARILLNRPEQFTFARQQLPRPQPGNSYTRRSVVAFSGRFGAILKLARLLAYWLYFRLIRSVVLKR